MNINIRIISVLILILLFLSITANIAIAGDLDFKFHIDKGVPTITGETMTGADSEDKAWNLLFEKYKTLIVGFSGIGAITSIGVFVISFIKLGAASGNPQARSQALTGLMWSGLGTVGLGSITLFTGLFSKVLF